MARSVYGAGVLSLYTVQYTVYTVYVVRVRYFSNFSYSVFRIPYTPETECTRTDIVTRKMEYIVPVKTKRCRKKFFCGTFVFLTVESK